jgi:16S rRNA (uracil1498-N3)-methyltransferase
MPAYTFFASQLAPQGGMLSPDEDEVRHIRVMRLHPGDEAWFIDGQGRRARARLVEATKNSSNWEVLELFEEPKPPAHILALPWMRGAKLDWIVEKAVELGVNQIWLFQARRSEEAKPRLDRLSQLMRSAMKQSGVLWEPTLEMKDPVTRWRADEMRQPLFFGSLQGQARRLPGLLLPPEWIWCAGPEAGWTPEEEVHLVSLGGTPIRLGPHVLRAETAAIAGMACLSALQADQMPKAEGAER